MNIPRICCGFWLLALALCGMEPVSAAGRMTKERMLQSLADQVLAPGYAKLAKCSREFAVATKELAATPDSPHVMAARAAWLATAIAAQELDGARIGPIADGGDGALFFFLPVRPASVERAIEQLPAEAGHAEMVRFGAAAKGLCAAEFLLFPPQGSPAIELAGEQGEKRRHYLVCLADEMAAKAGRIAKGWQAPLVPSAQRFISGGQDSLNQLINQMSMTSTHLATVRLAPLLDPESKMDRAKVPGLASGHSHELLQAAIRGLRELESGGMLAYTRQINPALVGRLEQQLGKTTESAGRFKQPLEAPDQAALLNECYAACSALDILLKLEQASSLGVTLTFIATDGD